MNTLKKSKLLSSSTQELLSFKEGGEECLISKPKYCRGQQIVAMMCLLDEHHKNNCLLKTKLVRTRPIVVSFFQLK